MRHLTVNLLFYIGELLRIFFLLFFHVVMIPFLGNTLAITTKIILFKFDEDAKPRSLGNIGVAILG